MKTPQERLKEILHHVQFNYDGMDGTSFISHYSDGELVNVEVEDYGLPYTRDISTRRLYEEDFPDMKGDFSFVSKWFPDVQRLLIEVKQSINIVSLKKCRELTQLAINVDFNLNNIINFEGNYMMPKVRLLFVDSNFIEPKSLSILNNFPNVRNLTLNMKNFAPIKVFPLVSNLNNLWLWHAKIESIDSFLELHKLKVLGLSDCKISKSNMKRLIELEYLTQLHINGKDYRLKGKLKI